MNNSDIKHLVESMLAAIKAAVGDKWKDIEVLAKSESKKFATNIAEIHLWKKESQITEEQAVVLLRMHKRSMKMVLTALEGISLVLAERAINAAIDTIRTTVNNLVGWTLL